MREPRGTARGKTRRAHAAPPRGGRGLHRRCLRERRHPGTPAEAGGDRPGVLNGPWVYGADKTPQQVLEVVTNELAAAARLNDESDERDKLLVFPVQMGEIGTGRNLKPAPIEPDGSSRVVAITYTLRNPPGDWRVDDAEQERHRVAVTEALQSLGATCHPLGALWFVKTDLSAHDVHLALEKAVPLSPKDELMVVEVDLDAHLRGRPVKGAEEGLDPGDRAWLAEAGVL